MKQVFFAVASVGLIALMAFAAIHASEIDSAFVRWLSAKGDPLIIQCYSMPKGSR